MNWQSICNDPILNNLPYKFETDRWGNFIMSPATNRHSHYQAMIAKLLVHYLSNGLAFPECIIKTSQGVKVTDVAWASAVFLKGAGLRQMSQPLSRSDLRVNFFYQQ